MLNSCLGIINYSILLLFGIYSSALFIGIPLNKKNTFSLLLLSAFLGFLQFSSYSLIGFKTTEQIYPIISHLPILIAFVFYFKKDVIDSIFSITTAYLFCQISKWFAILVLSLTNIKFTYYISQTIITVILFVLINKFFADAIKSIFSKDIKSKLIFIFLPLVYYMYDYAFTIYTNSLYDGNEVVFEFLPFILCVTYIIFCTVYFKEYEQKCEIKQYNQILDLQEKQRITFLESLKQAEYETSILRHDMRHFLNTISIYIKEGEAEKAIPYINEIIDTNDQIAVQKFSNHLMINMIVSFYSDTMKAKNIQFVHSIHISELINCPDLDISSILSNGLENAIHATEKVKDKKRIIFLSMSEINGKLLLSIKNTFLDKPIFDNGIPISLEANHGLGCKSIVHIVKRLKGQCEFYTEENMFIVKIIL